LPRQRPPLRPLAQPSLALLAVFMDQHANCKAACERVSEEPQRALMYRLVGQWQTEIDRLRAQLTGKESEEQMPGIPGFTPGNPALALKVGLSP
jgi:hypothetical protein